ncbi:MAG: tRNA (adenosine(37)-N6)-threonylcarbamoyltransferase complex ATPase subunit type 1 TsaE [Fidelibacterota bacterium]|nr:MAG: tRNA (adenosine(37)-N6)-threonylcarbamoyltransferase complex ATPase subunit type 1 TsaE [Candidatus Neomarinimicrobiota bacterium]
MPSRAVLEWAGATTRSPEETKQAGRELAGQLGPGDVVALHGELGSGKTTFVQGMAEGLGYRSPVSSPTFALIHEYGRPPVLYHLDCYRERSLERWGQLGLDEYFYGEAISVVEWAENIASLLPASTLHLTFTHGQRDNERRIGLQP